MEGFLHQVFAGLATGGIYASIALALVMIYQSTHHLNFAQGELAMFCTFIAWALIQAGWPYWAAFFATIAASFVLGLAIQRLLLRPFERAPVLTNVIVFIGLLVIFNSLAGWIFDYTIKPFPTPFPKDAWYVTKYFSGHEIGSIGVTVQGEHFIAEKTVTTSARVAYEHEFLDGYAITSSFVGAPGAPGTFTVVGDGVTDYLTLGLGADVELAPQTNLSLDYNGRFSTGYIENSGALTVQKKF